MLLALPCLLCALAYIPRPDPGTTCHMHTLFSGRYGEGWDFGEVHNNGRGVNGAQANLANTSIGRCVQSPAARL